MGKTSIEWTRGDDGAAGSTWNPVRGCSRLSPGCGGANHQGGCYAEKIAARFSGPGQPFEGFAERTTHGGRWTGKMAVAWDMVDQPIRWRKPRRIFANSMSDLFHKGLYRNDVAIIYGTAIAAVLLRGHTIQILTKRSDHMRDLLNDKAFWDAANDRAAGLIMHHNHPRTPAGDAAEAAFRSYGPKAPPPGIWLGVSVEDQQRADERIPDLLATPAAVRFLSCEPLLGEVDTAWAVSPNRLDIAAGFLKRGTFSPGLETLRPLDWVIVGGESGPRSRPMHPDWARGLRDQCAVAGVPFFFKQWGNWREAREGDTFDTSRGRANKPPAFIVKPDDGTLHCFMPRDADPRCRVMLEVGKKAAGAELDGKLHREFPT